MSTNVSLTPESEKFARSLIKSGFYSSMSEVMRAGLRSLKKEEMLWLHVLHKEVNAAAYQIDNGQTELHNMQDIIDRVDAKRAKTKND